MTPNPNADQMRFYQPPAGQNATPAPAPRPTLQNTAPGTMMRPASFGAPQRPVPSAGTAAEVPGLQPWQRPAGAVAPSPATAPAAPRWRPGPPPTSVATMMAENGAIAGARMGAPEPARPSPNPNAIGARPTTVANARKALGDFDTTSVPMPYGYVPADKRDPNMQQGFTEVRPGIFQRGNEFSDAAGLRDTKFWDRGAPSAKDDAIMTRMAQRDQAAARATVAGSNWATNMARTDPTSYNALARWAGSVQPSAEKAPTEPGRLRGGSAPAAPTMQTIQNRQYSLRDFDPLAIGEDGNFVFRP